MTNETFEEMWRDYQADALTDPQYRYSHDHKAIFRAGWTAAQRKTSGVRESIWVSAPVAPDDDPE